MTDPASGAGGRKDIPVLYEDNHVLVVVKPVNMPTQEDESGDLDLLTALKDDLKRRHNKPGNVYLGLIHRLDRPVGGAMLFAKTSKAASRLSDAVRTRSFGKEYEAVLHGTMSQASGRLVHYLLKDAKTNIFSAFRQDTPGAKEAILDYETVSFKAGLSLIRIKLLTGRSHQIRVQFAASGCPLYGDQKYGAIRNKPGQQIALWSVSVAFDHPVSKERLTFRSTPPMEHPWQLFAK